LGLLGIGWIFDLFWMPVLARSANRRYYDGPYSYDFAWLLQTFLGIFGLHRMYIGKWVSGVIWLLTGGLFFVGYICDDLTRNEQVSLASQAASEVAGARLTGAAPRARSRGRRSRGRSSGPRARSSP